MAGLNFTSGIDKGFEKDLERMNKKMRSFTTDTVKGTDKMDASFAKLGGTLAGVISVGAFAAAGKEVVDFSKKVETALTEVSTISEDVTNNFQEYKDQLLALSTSELQGAAGAEALTNSFYDIVSAGNDATAAMGILEVAGLAATAGSSKGIIDVATAGDGLTTVLNAFNKKASEANNVADLFFTTVERGKTTFSELGKGIPEVASLAASMGVDFKEVSGAIATMTAQGTKTPQAFTQMKAALNGVNKVLGDGWGDLMTYQEALIEVRERAGGSSNKLQTMLGSVEAVNAVLALTGDNASKAAADLAAMDESLGATQRAAEKMAQTTALQITNLKNNILAALEPLGAEATGVIGKLAGTLNKAFKSGDIEKYVKVIGLLTAAFTTYKVSVIALNQVRKIQAVLLKNNIAAMRLTAATGKTVTAGNYLMAKSFKSLKAAFVGNPVGLLITALTIVIPLIYEFSQGIEKSTKATDDLNKSIADEKVGMDAAFEAINKTKEGTVERKTAIEKLNTEYGKYLPNLLTESSSLGDVKTAQEGANTALINSIVLREQAAKRGTILQERVNRELALFAELSESTGKSVAELSQEFSDFYAGQADELSGNVFARGMTTTLGLYDEANDKLSDITTNLLSGRDKDKASLQELTDLYEGYLVKIKETKKTVDEKKDVIVETGETEKEIIKERTADYNVTEEQLDNIALLLQHIKDVQAGINNTTGKQRDIWAESEDLLIEIDVLANTLANSFDEIGAGAKGALNAVSGLAAGAINIGRSIQTVTASMNALEKSTVILAVISAALQAVSIVTNEIQASQERKSEAYLDELRYIQYANLALIEQNRLYAEGNELFASDKWGTALQGLKSYNLALEAQDRLFESISNRSSKGLDAVELTAFVLNAKLAEQGASDLEKALLSISVTTKKGGWFSSAEYSNLLLLFPELIKENGKLDAAVLQQILDTEELGDVERERLTQLVELTDAAQKSYEQFGSYISGIFGGVGDEITAAFQQAYESGEDAMQLLEGSFSEMIEAFTRDAIEFAILQPIINELNATNEALGVAYGEDRNADKLQQGILDSLSTFYDQVADRGSLIDDTFEKADRLAATAGFGSAFDAPKEDVPAAIIEDIIPPKIIVPGIVIPEQINSIADVSATPQSQSVAGEIRGTINEDTGNLIGGRLGAIMNSNQLIANNSGQMLDYAIRNLVYLNKIAANTDYLPEIAANTKKTVEKLENI